MLLEITKVLFGDTEENATWKFTVDEPNTFHTDPVTATHSETGREYTLYPNGDIEEHDSSTDES